MQLEMELVKQTAIAHRVAQEFQIGYSGHVFFVPYHLEDHYGILLHDRVVDKFLTVDPLMRVVDLPLILFLLL